MARRRSMLRTIAGMVSIAFLKCTARLPLGACRSLGRGIGTLAYLLVPRVSKVALANLDLAYGDSIPRDEKKSIARHAAQNMGIVAAEFSHGPLVREKRIAVHVQGIEHVDRNAGAIAVGAHLGNWEWLAGAVYPSGYRMAEVVRPLDDPRLNRVIDTMRQSCGALTVSKDAPASELRRLIREGYLVGVLVDQSPRENGVPVTFLGQSTWATSGPALIALRSRAPLHVVSITRDAAGDYTVAFSPRIDTHTSGNLYRDLVDLTQRMQDEIERLIRQHPGQWLWMHRRFKPRPQLAEDWKARTERRQGT